MNPNKIMFLRKRKGLTQIEMGKIIGVKNYSIHSWEKGKEIIPLYNLNTYANYFNVSMDYIMNLSDDSTPTNNIDKLDKEFIGNKIKEIRINNHLTQRELAKILNTNHSVIARYESGKTLILTAFLYQICKTYNLSMDNICGRCEK